MTATAFVAPVVATHGTSDPSAPLVVPGHQPALYHPGVWAKNFAAAGIAVVFSSGNSSFGDQDDPEVLDGSRPTVTSLHEVHGPTFPAPAA